ncbi:hypothetical protein IJG29_01935 [Candidatus Saccharibacteria bacterium]|nr:hypothetical protein [Candidatus Saccharibacteria bacterium]
MDQVAFQHAKLAAGGWAEMSFAKQMGNIGSEVSRAMRWYGKNEARFSSSFNRALELFDLSIMATKEHGKLKELCRAREELCDYFNGNNWRSDAKAIQRYYDQFVLLARS